jgi:hypothetical protein
MEFSLQFLINVATIPKIQNDTIGNECGETLNLELNEFLYL